MTKTKSTFLALLAVLLSPMAANATPITIGALSSNDDGSTETILDSLNNLEWLRWDVLELSFSQTVAAIGAGGSHEGWSFAHNAEAQLFVDALFHPLANACSTSGDDFCGSVDESMTALTGLNFGFGSLSALFLTDASSLPGAVGSIRVWDFSDLKAEEVRFDIYKRNDFTPCEGICILPDPPPPYILYRTRTISVPEPGTLALFAFGLAGMGLMRRRRKG